MIKDNNFLDKLYSEMIANSPRTCSMNVPSEMGTGTITQTTTKQGVELTDWQMCYSSEVNVQPSKNQTILHIILCLNEI